MRSSLADYRTTSGVSRRLAAESVLAKYIRVARVLAPHLSQTYPLPVPRPLIETALSVSDYRMLLEVLDELLILEAAARFSDRKSSAIARRRFYAALAEESGCSAVDILDLLITVKRESLPVLRRVAQVILQDRHYTVDGNSAQSANGEVIQFPIR